MKVAFIKFDGLGFGGTERWMQSLARELSTRGVKIDYFSCSTPGLTSAEDEDRQRHRKRLEDSGIDVVECKIANRNLKYRHHPWQGSDLWQNFDPHQYDIVQAAKAGHPEYPFTEWRRRNVVEFRSLDARVDNSPSIAWSVHLSQYQRRLWLARGGNQRRSSVTPIPVDLPETQDNLRDELGISKGSLVVGFHQRDDDRIWSPIPLEAYARFNSSAMHFVLLGGSKSYAKQASALGIKNFIQLGHSGNGETISRFLNTIDIFTHGRRDGETFGSVLAEAMSKGKPCISHHSNHGANAQPETMGPGGFFALNTNEYAQALGDLIESLDLRARIGAAAKRHASAYYSQDAAAASLLRGYDAVYRPTKDHLIPPDHSANSYSFSPLGFLQSGDLEHSESLGFFAMRDAIPEHFDLLIAKYFIKDARVMLDIGSNIGLYGLTAISSNPNVRVWCIEPQQDCTRALERTRELNRWNKRMNIAQIALSSESGNATIFPAGSGSSLVKGFNADLYQSPYTVKIETLDTWLESEHLSRVDLIKIDVEGHEYAVLQGATGTLSTLRPVLIIEMAERIRGRDYTNPHYGATIKFLEDHSYVVYRSFASLGLRRVHSNSSSSHIHNYFCVPRESLEDFKRWKRYAVPGIAISVSGSKLRRKLAKVLARVRASTSSCWDQVSISIYRAN